MGKNEFSQKNWSLSVFTFYKYLPSLSKKNKKKKLMSSYWEKHSTDRKTENGSFTGAPAYRGSNKMDSC